MALYIALPTALHADEVAPESAYRETGTEAGVANVPVNKGVPQTLFGGYSTAQVNTNGTSKVSTQSTQANPK